MSTHAPNSDANSSDKALAQLAEKFTPAERQLLSSYANHVDLVIAGADNGFGSTDDGHRARELVESRPDARQYFELLVNEMRAEVVQAFLGSFGFQKE